MILSMDLEQHISIRHAEMFVKANEIMDVKKYSDAIDEANAVYAKALPYMEKAHELNLTIFMQ